MTKLGEGSQEALAKNFVRKILTKMAKTGPVRIEDSKYTPFCLSKSFFRRENDLQSWNTTFLSIRSPNPLPKVSGLENLTSLSGPIVDTIAAKWNQAEPSGF